MVSPANMDAVTDGGLPSIKQLPEIAWGTTFHCSFLRNGLCSLHTTHLDSYQSNHRSNTGLTNEEMVDSEAKVALALVVLVVLVVLVEIWSCSR